MQPAAQFKMGSEGACFAHEHQESGLEGIFGVRCIAEDPVADRQHHGTVPVHQRCEGRLIVAEKKFLQELPIRLALDPVYP
jgi:hypothetical protein